MNTHTLRHIEEENKAMPLIFWYLYHGNPSLLLESQHWRSSSEI